MATLNANDLSLADIAKRMDPDGSASAIAEMLSQKTEILDDIPWIEGNLPTGHRTTVRTGLPDVAWRKLNKGVPRSKSRTAQIDETCGMLEAFGHVDVDLAMLNGNTNTFRLQENAAFMEAMAQEQASTLFYGDTDTSPEEYLGLAPRFSSLSAENGDNIITGGGSGSDNTSIWLVGWGPNTVHGIYPKGSKAGLFHEDLGKDRVQDSDGNDYMALIDHYQWKCGLALRDWRYVVRIANIDSSALVKDASAGADLIDLLTQALEKIHSLDGVRPVFYGNRKVGSFLRRQIVNKVAASTLSREEVYGKMATTIEGVPFRRVDAITNAEATVS